MTTVKGLAIPRRIGYLLSALVVLVIADGLITQFLIRTGLGRESNPFLKDIVGESIFLPLKVLGAVLCAFILWDIHKRWPKLALVATSCFVALYSGIVLWNTAVFLIARA